MTLVAPVYDEQEAPPNLLGILISCCLQIDRQLVSLGDGSMDGSVWSWISWQESLPSGSPIIKYSKEVSALIETIILPAKTVILGVQLLLAEIQVDIQAVPRKLLDKR